MKLIDIAAFNLPNEASILESILMAENIQYFINRHSNTYVFSYHGGILSINEEDKERVVEIIKDAGFGKYLIG